MQIHGTCISNLAAAALKIDYLTKWNNQCQQTCIATEDKTVDGQGDRITEIVDGDVVNRRCGPVVKELHFYLERPSPVAYI